MDDPFNLQRFLDAQKLVYEEVCEELRRGSKRSHWMWFIFPQIQGLGESSMARKYAIGSLDEAKAFLRHPVLGPRLIECTNLVNQVDGKNIHQILGFPDDMKFRSSMTLFASAALDQPVFQTALEKYFDGQHDPLTLARL